MDTNEIKEFYNKSLSESSNRYEFDRWQKNSQARSSYASTKDAIEKFALPLLNKQAYIFELGPGPGTWTKFLLKKAPNAHYDLVDISSEMLNQARENLSDYRNVNLIQSDILEYTPTKKYDFFFSSRIIEYVPDKKKAVDIISNSLNSGSYGYLVTKTPQYKRFFRKTSYSSVHRNQINPNDLTQYFSDAGCQVVDVVNVTSVFPGFRSGFLDRVLTIICRYVPFKFATLFSESYAIIFYKK